jgi:hypothetical protein
MRGMVWFLLAVIVLLVVRWRLVHRVQSPLDPEPFEGLAAARVVAPALATGTSQTGSDER